MLPMPDHLTNEITYEDVQNAIRNALDLHVFVNDPLLLSAVERLTPCLGTDNPDRVEMTRSATVAYEFLTKMTEAKVVLYGH
jgi:hypothetical protein